MHPRELGKLEARILWLEKRLNEREELITDLLDELCRLRKKEKA
jgi:uncharacterized coiled-coil protein SlyX